MLEGEAVITSSGTIINQGAKTIQYVISTVGPKGPADKTKDKLLFNAYYNSLLLAAGIKNSNLFKTVAFPSISTGIFKYPADHAAPAAISGIIQAIQEFPESFDTVQLVIHPGNVAKPPYAIEIQKPRYKRMINNENEPSPVAISIQKMNDSKQVIYQP